MPLNSLGVCIEVRITKIISKKNSSHDAKDESINTAANRVSSKNIIPSKKKCESGNECDRFYFRIMNWYSPSV